MSNHFIRYAIAYATALAERTRSPWVARNLRELIEELKELAK